jgi:hypothetical protein
VTIAWVPLSLPLTAVFCWHVCCRNRYPPTSDVLEEELEIDPVQWVAKWDPIAASIIAACRDPEIVGKVKPFLERLAQTAPLRATASALLQLLDGERDRTRVLAALLLRDAMIVGAVLDAVES